MDPFDHEGMYAYNKKRQAGSKELFSTAFAGKWLGPNYSANRILKNGEKLTKEDLKVDATDSYDLAGKYHDIMYNLSLGLKDPEMRKAFLDKSDDVLIERLNRDSFERMGIKYSDAGNLTSFQRLKLALSNLAEPFNLKSNLVGGAFNVVKDGYLSRPMFDKLDITREDFEAYVEELSKDEFNKKFIDEITPYYSQTESQNYFSDINKGIEMELNPQLALIKHQNDSQGLGADLVNPSLYVSSLNPELYQSEKSEEKEDSNEYLIQALALLLL